MFKTKDGKKINLEVLTWAEARKVLLPILPNLVEIIDEINPGAEYKLYKAKYQFGARIINKTKVYLPLENGSSISFNDPDLPQELTHELGYDPEKSNPLGLIIKNKCEFYLPIGERIMPYQIIAPGELFGLPRILDNCARNEHNLVEERSSNSSAFMWELISGARSIFMLPKVTDSIGHNKLKKRYSLTTDKPASYIDHWSVFKDILQKEQDPWHTEVIYFSNKWFETLSDSKWAKLYGHFLRINRLSHKIWHNILSWDVTFSLIEQTKNLDFSAYTLSSARHLFAIAANGLPGFKPATDESLAPIKTIQEAYISGYELTDYWPTIMEPALFSADSDQAVYYSLNYPTLAQYNPQSFKGKSIITLLDELQFVVNRYQSSIREDNMIRSASLRKAATAANFTYFHSDPGSYTEIQDNSIIAEEDSRFKPKVATGEFPKHSAFLKGCIRIAPNKKDATEE